MATEIEMKLKVPDLDTLNHIFSDPELLQYTKDDFEVLHMQSTYYDTPDHQLHQRKWVLRLRKEDTQTVAAFKTANMTDNAGFFTRNEWQVAVDNVYDAIPMLIDLGAPRELKSILKGRELRPCCGAEFQRRCVCLFLDDGIRIEMAGDYGELFAGDNRESICELELELLYGDAGSLPPLCEQILSDYDLQEESLSKYERAKLLMEKSQN